MTYRDQRRGPSIDEQVTQITLDLAPADAIHMIIEGNDAQSILLLNSIAEKIGKEIALRGVTTSQIRLIFSEVRTIEQEVTNDEGEELPFSVQRSLTMLKPKLAYQFARASDTKGKVGMGVLKEVLSHAIDHVGQNVKNFHNFMDFFEATLAYHRYYTSKQKQ